MLKKEVVNNMSPHLFWDVDRDVLDLSTHEAFIVQRVMEYGLQSDWTLLKHSLGVKRISDVCMKLRTLDPKALAFISLISKTPKENYRCYSTRRSIPTPWNS